MFRLRSLLLSCLAVPCLAFAGEKLLVQPRGLSKAEVQKAVGSLGKVRAGKDNSLLLVLNNGINPRAAYQRLTAKGLMVSLPKSGSTPLRVSTPEKSPDFKEAMRWFAEVRKDANGTIDWSALEEATLHRERMSPGLFRAPNGTMRPTGKWEFIGPTNAVPWGRTHFGTGGIAGRVNAAAFDPFDSNTFYVGAAYGGVWKTTDAGVTWTCLTDSQKTLHVSSIVLDPNNQGHIYVGTGDFPAGQGNASGFESGLGFGDGVWKSEDGGQTWNDAVRLSSKSAFGNTAVSNLLLVPGTQTLIATTGRGQKGVSNVYRSPDGGSTWNAVKLTPSGDDDLAIWSGASISEPDGNGVRRIWITARGINPLIYTSIDGGLNWTKSNLAAPMQQANSTVVVAASKRNKDRAYVLVSDRPTGNVYRTDNGGTTWNAVGNNLPNPTLGTTANFNWTQSFYNYFINTAPWVGHDGALVEAVYVGQIDIAMSLYGQDSWATFGGPTFTANAKTHNDQHCLAVDPNNPRRMIVGNDGGAYLVSHDPRTNSSSWNSLNGSLGITQFYKIDTHPTQEFRVMGGTQDNGTFRSKVDGTSVAAFNQWGSAPSGGDGAQVIYDHTFPNTQYVTNNNNQVYRSNDGGVTFTNITPSTTNGSTTVTWGGQPTAFVGALTMDPNNRRYLYAGTNMLWRYDASANAWTQLGTSFQNGTANDTVTAVEVAKGDSNVIFVGTRLGRLYYSENFGANFFAVGTGLPVAYTTAISSDPTNKFKVLVAQGSYNQRNLFSGDVKSTVSPMWHDVCGPEPRSNVSLPPVGVNDIERDLDFPHSTWFAATDAGVHMTNDGGQTWQDLTLYDLPNVQVNDLDINKNSRWLHAGTFGRGMWRIKVPAFGVAIQLNPQTVKGEESSLGVLQLGEPAPAGGLTFALSDSSDIAGVPAFVTVPEGGMNADFPITTARTNIAVDVVITAISGQLKATTLLKVEPNAIGAMTVSPNDGIWGGSVHPTGTIKINYPAPYSGVDFVLTSSNPSAATVPNYASVAWKSTIADFQIQTHLVSADTNVVITAKGANDQRTFQITVKANRPTSLTLNPTSVWGGSQASTGTCKISYAAPYSGIDVEVKSSDPSVASVASSGVGVAWKADSCDFVINTYMVSATKSVTISATALGGTKTANLTVKNNGVIGLVLNPARVVGGVETSTGTATIDYEAPYDGVPFTLVSSHPSVASFEYANNGVAWHATSANFQIRTGGVKANTVVTITATANGKSRTATLTVVPPVLNAFTITPNPIIGGSQATGEVGIASSAPAGGLVVTLSSASSAVQVPASVTISEGAYSASFAIKTQPVGATATRRVTATLASVSKYVDVTLQGGGLSSVSVSPNPVVGGSNAMGTVTLSAARASAADVALKSNSSALIVPASVTVPGGSATATFAVGTGVVSATTVRTITATLDSVSKTVNVTLTARPFGLDSVSISPTSVQGGASATGTVRMTGAAPSSTVVTLASNSSVLVVPSSVTVAAGASTASFAVTTKPVTATATRQVIATYNGVSRTASLTLTP